MRGHCRVKFFSLFKYVRIFVILSITLPYFAFCDENSQENQVCTLVCGPGRFERFLKDELRGVDEALFILDSNLFQPNSNEQYQSKIRSFRHEQTIKINISRNAYLLLPYPESHGFGKNGRRFLECDWRKGEILLGCVDDFKEKYEKLRRTVSVEDALNIPFTLGAVCGTKNEALTFLFQRLPNINYDTQKGLQRKQKRKDELDFIFAGWQRSGSRNFWYLLREHPNVDLPGVNNSVLFKPEECNTEWCQNKKEYQAHHYFNRLYDSVSVDRFLDQFDFNKVTGEKTPTYITHTTAIRRIHHHFPNVKWLVLARNPINRLYSHYQMNLGKGRVSGSFLEFTIKELFSVNQAWAFGGEKRESILHHNSEDFVPSFPEDSWASSYLSSPIRLGFYAQQLDVWSDIFGDKKDQLLIIRSEDYFEDNLESLNRVWRFLGVEELSETPESSAHVLNDYNPGDEWGKRKVPYSKMDARMLPLLREVYKSHNLEMKMKYGIEWET